jgi:predicted RNA-binding protein YlxR (DUF448 family)
MSEEEKLIYLACDKYKMCEDCLNKLGYIKTKEIPLRKCVNCEESLPETDMFFRVTYKKVCIRCEENVDYIKQQDHIKKIKAIKKLFSTSEQPKEPISLYLLSVTKSNVLLGYKIGISTCVESRVRSLNKHWSELGITLDLIESTKKLHPVDAKGLEQSLLNILRITDLQLIIDNNIEGYTEMLKPEGKSIVCSVLNSIS